MIVVNWLVIFFLSANRPGVYLPGQGGGWVKTKPMSTEEQDNFRLNCKRFMLTYPQYEADKKQLHEFINRKTRQETEVKIAHEHHQDGNIHTHAVVKCQRKIDVKSSRFFDHIGHHPNISVPMSETHWKNQIKYMEKEDPEPYGTLEVTLTTDEKFDAATQYVLACKSLRDIYRPGEHLKTISSKVTFFENLWKNQGSRRKTEAKHTDFNREKITDWSKSWLIYGEAGTGKTQFALSHFKNALLVSHMDQLKDLNPEVHDGIIFDDMAFNHMPPSAIIHILDIDNDRAIHCRFTVAEIPSNTKKIFVHNRRDIFQPTTLINEDQQEAIDRRYNVIHVAGKLF